jgi:hypothetical protein
MKMRDLAFYSVLVFTIACGSKDDDSATSSSGDGDDDSVATSSYITTYEKMVESTPKISNGSGILPSRRIYPKGEFQGLWDNVTKNLWSVTPDGGSAVNMNPKDYVTYMLEEENEFSIFWRARNPFMIACTLDILAQKTGELFTAGSQSIAFTDVVIDVCGPEESLSPLVGETLEIVVTNLSDTTNYDQMILIDADSNPFFGKDQWIYVRNNDSLMNFTHVEGDATDLFVSTVSFDKVTEGGSFQYLSKNSDIVILYRLFVDNENNLSRVFSYEKLLSNNKDINVSLASTTTNQTEISISMNWNNAPNPYDGPMSTADACLDATSGEVVSGTDGFPECPGNGLEAHGVFNAFTLKSNFNSLNISTLATDAAAGDLDDNLPTFDGDTILSQSSLGL